MITTTPEEIQSNLAQIGVPVSYHAFPEGNAPSPPFICWILPDSNDMVADNHNYQRIRTLHVELYTSTKNFDLETAIEDLLDNLKMPYEKNETYIKSEKLHEVVFQTSVLF